VALRRNADQKMDTVGLNRNAAYNILAGLSSALVSLALPPLLARLLLPHDFAAWTLALQVAAYLNILSFGLQMVVAQAVAQSEASNDNEGRDRVVSTGFFALFIAALFGFALMAVLAWQSQWLAPTLALETRVSLEKSLLWLAASFIVQLPVSILLAVFIGEQRNAWFAAATICSRAVILVAVGVVAIATMDIVAMGQAWFGASVIGGAFSWWMWFRHIRQPRLSWRLCRWDALHKLVRGSAALTVWNLSLLFVTGLQILLVAHFEFALVPAFAGALSMTALLVGVVAAVTGTLVPHIAHAAARPDAHFPEADLRHIARLSNLILYGGTAVLLIGNWWILRYWLGLSFADAGGPVLAVIALAQAIRNSISAYVMTTIALSLQNRLLAGPIAEGIIAFGLGFVFGSSWGALGVALAMLVAPIANVSFVMWRDPVGKKFPSFLRVRYIMDTAIFPAIPLAITGVTYGLLPDGSFSGSIAIVAALLLAIVYGICVLLAYRTRPVASRLARVNDLGI
jgi:O-antigen/teichoic acid export membrane protein